MWQVRKLADEGTSEPYIARLWVGAFELRDMLLQHLARGHSDFETRRTHFDERYQPVLNALDSARKHARAIQALLSEHKMKVSSGAIVTRQQNAIEINETITLKLQEQMAAFLSASVRAAKLVQVLLLYFDLNIGFLFQQQPKFAAASESLRAAGDSDLAGYLERTRSGWLEALTKRRHALEHKGWCVPDVHYIAQSDGSVLVVEPDIDCRPISEFVSTTIDRLLGFIEDMLAVAVQRGIKDIGDLIDIPKEKRDPANAKRFRLGIPALQPGERFWRLRYTDYGFYGS